MNREIIAAKAIISDKPAKDQDTAQPEELTATEQVVTPNEARQGPLGKPIFLVLAFSLALCALYLVGLMIWSAIDNNYFRPMP